MKNFLILDSTKVCYIENSALTFFSQHADENDVEHAMIFSYVCVCVDPTNARILGVNEQL